MLRGTFFLRFNHVPPQSPFQLQLHTYAKLADVIICFIDRRSYCSLSMPVIALSLYELYAIRLEVVILIYS